MVKKVLVVLVALVVASLASASSVSFSNNGATITAAAGSTVDLFLTSDSKLISLDALVALTGDGIISAATGKTTAAAMGWDAGLSFDPAFSNGNKTVEIALGNFNLAPVGNVALVSVLYNGGTVLVNLSGAQGQGGSMDESYGTPNLSGMVTIVPEPITMSLLGLGGLFLARRKN